MVVKVLGPLDTATDPLSPRERTMLSALIVRIGTTVAPAELADAWWGESPPSTWEQQVRNSIARIRARLGRDAVVTVGADYRLGIDPDSIDAVRFELLVSAARSHRLREEHDRAVDAYTRALALWRGAPLQDVANWEPGIVETLRLGQIRASVEEELLDARLDAGEHRALIPDAERLLREQPLREDRWSILALANYRADRQAEALAVLRAARERLADELGVEPGPRLAALELSMLRRGAELDAPAPLLTAASTCPYPGLRSFGPSDADYFFGRDDEIEAVLDRLQPGGLVTIAGASGAGKSSLMLAGVLPRLRARGRSVTVVRPGLGGALAARRAIERGAVLAIDQAEELLELALADLGAYARIVRDVLDGDGSVVATARSDALDALLRVPFIGSEVGRGVYLLGPLTEPAYRRAIEEPARASGLRIESGLVELAVRDAGDRGATLPHLSHAMQETWGRREGATLTVEGYQLSGGIAGAIAQSAEDAFRDLSPEEQVICRSLLMRLIERGAGSPPTRRRVAFEPLAADPMRRRVLERLTSARLVSTDSDSVSIAHEAVASAWPRLTDWLDEDADGARSLRVVEAAAAAWESAGRVDDDLLRGARLHDAVEWCAAADPDLTQSERAFLAASEQHEQGAVRELERRALRDRRRSRILGGALCGAALLLVAAVAAGSIAAVRSQEAEASADSAHVEAIVGTSLSLLDNDRETASLLAAEAYRRWPDDPRVRSALWGVATESGGLVDAHRMDDGHFPVLAPIADTGTALRAMLPAPGAPRAIVDVVDLTTGETLRTLDLDLPGLPPGLAHSVQVSADASWAVIQSPRYTDPIADEQCCWNHLAFVDLDSGRMLPGSGLLKMRTSEKIVIDDAMHRVLLAHPVTADVIAVDARTGAVAASSPEAFADHSGIPGSFDAVNIVDDQFVAVGAGDHVRLYDRATLAFVRTIALDGGDVASLEVIADGRGGLITTGWEGTQRVLLATGQRLWQRSPALPQMCHRMHLASANAIACVSYQAASLLDIDSGETIGGVIPLQLNWVPLVETIDASTLLLSNVDPAMWMRWNVDGGSAVSHRIADGRVLVDGPEEGGSLLVTMPAGGGRMQLWDAESDQPVGKESDLIVPLGSGMIARYETYDGSGAPVLENLETGVAVPFSLPGAPEHFEVVSGGWESMAFAWWEGAVVPFDPATGQARGPELTAQGASMDDVVSATATPDDTRAVVTWWTADTNLTETGVFDIASGHVIARGLEGLEESAALDDDQLVGVASSFARRYDLDDLGAVSTLARAVGGSILISVSRDARTILNVGWNNSLTLYDATADIALAGPLDGDVENVRGGFLTADGESLYSVLPDGIRVWDLRPAAQADAACALAGRELTEEEWSTYFPEEPQVATCAVLAD